MDNDTLNDLVPGTAVNLIGEAMDGYDLEGEHITRSEVFRLEVVTPSNYLHFSSEENLVCVPALNKPLTR